MPIRHLDYLVTCIYMARQRWVTQKMNASCLWAYHAHTLRSELWGQHLPSPFPMSFYPMWGQPFLQVPSFPAQYNKCIQSNVGIMCSGIHEIVVHERQLTTNSGSPRSGGFHYEAEACSYHYYFGHMLIWRFLVAEVSMEAMTILCMSGVLEAGQFEAITMEEPFRGHSFIVSFLPLPSGICWVPLEMLPSLPSLLFLHMSSVSTAFCRASHCQWHCCT